MPRRQPLSFSSCKRPLRELLLIAGVIWASLYLFARLAAGAWGDLFLFNGDSILLPLVGRSVERGEPFGWVFSAPLFFFPEGPVYFVCALVTPSVQWALIVNGVVNVLLIHLLVRLVAARLLMSRALGSMTAVLLTVLLMLFVISERDRQPQGAYATLVLFNTYYVGVIILGLLLLYLVLRLPTIDEPHFWIVIASIVTLVTAGSASDPLLIIQVVVPLLASVVVLWATRTSERKSALCLIGAMSGGVLLALVLRATVLERFIVADVDGYLKPFDLGQSWRSLQSILGVAWRDSLQRFELLSILAAIAGSSVLAIWTAVTGRGRPERAPATLMASFAAFSTSAIVASVLISNTVLTRYMIPVVIFPFLAFVPLLTRVRPGAPRRALAMAASFALFVLALLGIHDLGDLRAFAARQPAGATCLDDALAAQHVQYGVAFFWRARALDLYSDHERILQVREDFTAFSWLTNVDAYEDKDFRFVLVDTPAPPHASLSAEETVAQLGPPRSITTCGSFDVYFYGDDTDGHTVLNARIADSVD